MKVKKANSRCADNLGDEAGSVSVQVPMIILYSAGPPFRW